MKTNLKPKTTHLYNGSVVLLIPILIGLFVTIVSTFMVKQTLLSYKLYSNTQASVLADSYAKSSLAHFLVKFKDSNCQITPLNCDLTSMSKESYNEADSDIKKLADLYKLSVKVTKKPNKIEPNKKLVFGLESTKSYPIPIINTQESKTVSATSTVSFSEN